MKVLQINTWDTRGGAAKVAASLKRKLEENGIGSPMFVRDKFTKNQNVYEIRRNGFLTSALSKMTGKNIPSRLASKLSYLLANDLTLASSDQLLTTDVFKQADLVHCHNIHGNYLNLHTLKKISRVKPTLWTLHDMWAVTPHCANSFDPDPDEHGFYRCESRKDYPPIAWKNENRLKRIKEKIYRESDLHLVVPSVWLKEKIAKSVLKDKPVTVIYNGVNTNTFSPADDREILRRQLSLPTDKRIILFVGKSSPLEGLDFFTQVIKHCKNDFYFIAIGPEKTESPGIFHVPFIHKEEELAMYYAASDLLVYPSIADNCPLVVLEAMSSGLPVVSFHTGGIPELIRHKETGYVAGYKDIEDLINGIRLILGLSERQYKQYCRKSREIALSSFSIEKMAFDYIALYRKIINHVHA